LVGGIEQSVSAWLDGEQAERIINSFGYGFALGFALSGAFKGAAKIISKAGQAISPEITKLTNKISPKLTEKVSKMSDKLGARIGKCKLKADSTWFHSKYISRKVALRTESLARKSFNQIMEGDAVDANGNVLSKGELWEKFLDADDGTVLAHSLEGGDGGRYVKRNGMLGLEFDSNKFVQVDVPGGLSSNRNQNFINAAANLKDKWLDDSSSMPESIARAIDETGIELEDMSPKRLKTIIQNSDWVMHENIDLATITLVPREIHKSIGHMGGVGLAKYLKSHLASELFDRFVSAAGTMAVQATN
jgi:hypothetical protein